MNAPLTDLAIEEATTMVRLLEADGRKVLVVCVVTDATGTHCLHRASPDTRASEARRLLSGLRYAADAVSRQIEEARP